MNILASYTQNGNDLMDAITTLFGIGVVGGVSVLYILAIFTVIIMAYASVFVIYILSSLSLYQMAKKMGHPRPWMAWIPFANYYLMFTLPEKMFTIALFHKELKSRTSAFWIWLVLVWGSFFVLSILSMFAAIVGWIPILGHLILVVVGLISSVFPLVRIIVVIVFSYGMYYDLFELFVPEDTVRNYAIITVVGNCLSIPLIPAIMLFVVSRNEVRTQQIIDTNAGLFQDAE